MLSSSSSISANGNTKKTINDFRGTFVKLISKAVTSEGSSATQTAEGARSSSKNNLVVSKTFDTSSFTVCARVRPMLPHERDSGDFVACVAGKSVQENVENITVCTPKLNFRGQPKIETKLFGFDHVFGADSTNEELAEVALKPLLHRALNGQVGVIFAYGQTGSGKTHSMNGMMDHILQSDLFNDSTSISFSYIEILGTYINDCLGPNDSRHSSDEAVAIGETMDGRAVVRNISSHVVQSSEELSTLVERAKSLRSTAATEKNATSSRSHGIGIITCTDRKTNIEGSLYVIDLAGSERSYRRSKLTLLMKDVFDAGCTRLCSTVVLATCSPLASDVSHSANTLKYSSPLRGGGILNDGGKKVKMQVDASDPVLWSNMQVIEWMRKTYPSIVNPSIFVEELSGVQLCALPEKEYYSRLENTGMSCADADSNKLAKDIYLAIWTLMSDAKTRKRRKDGSIITIEDEEKERLRIVKATEEKARTWVEREKHLKSEVSVVS
uniref:Kinesin-like protein n=1 Tax=Ditylum brightwellii TaxID=49249 RepID=A0A7S4T5M3_9STRA